MNATKPRTNAGDIIRLYGYPGTFRVISPRTANGQVYAQPLVKDGLAAFPSWDASIVEINGERVAMKSLPIAPPADDYPHPTTLIDPPAEERTYGLFNTVAADKRFEIVRPETTARKWQPSQVWAAAKRAGVKDRDAVEVEYRKTGKLPPEVIEVIHDWPAGPTMADFN